MKVCGFNLTVHPILESTNDVQMWEPPEIGVLFWCQSECFGAILSAPGF